MSEHTVVVLAAIGAVLVIVFLLRDRIKSLLFPGIGTITAQAPDDRTKMSSVKDVRVAASDDVDVTAQGKGSSTSGVKISDNSSGVRIGSDTSK